MLAEDDQLPSLAVGVEHLRRVLKQRRQLLPLAVGSGRADLTGDLFQTTKRLDLELQLGDGAGGRGLIDELLLELLELTFGEVVDVEVVVIRASDSEGIDGVPISAAISAPRLRIRSSAIRCSSRRRRRASDWKIASGDEARRR